MTTETQTLAGIEFRPEELRTAWSNGARCIAKGRKLYLLKDHGEFFTAREVYTVREGLPLSARGRFHLLSPEAANEALGFKLLLSLEDWI